MFDDTHLNMELEITRDGDGPDCAKVTNHLKYKNRLTIGRSHNTTILDTSMYKVDYKDSHKPSLAANVIAENIFYQVDGEGNWYVLFQDIFDHR